MINPLYLREVSPVKYKLSRKHSGSQLCDSLGSRLDYVIPGVEVTAGLDFFFIQYFTHCLQAYIVVG